MKLTVKYSQSAIYVKLKVSFRLKHIFQFFILILKTITIGTIVIGFNLKKYKIIIF